LLPILDLCSTALANSFVEPGRHAEPEPRYPLRLVRCGSCGLVQIDEEVAPEVLFKHYVYVSGTSDVILRHAGFLASHFANHCPLEKGDLVLEAASNDGTVLRAFQKFGVRTLGIEPAENIAATARSAGIDTVCAFFNATTAAQIRSVHGPAKLILARHVLAHVADLHGFIRGLGLVLDHDGLAVIEVPHLASFHGNLEYDTIYHEHLCYFSVRVLRQLFEQLDMELVAVLEMPIHGGCVVVSAQRQGGPRQVEPSVQRLIEREERAGLHRAGTWQSFARRVAAQKAGLVAELDRLRAAGRTLAGYGAPAKGMTLLAHCGIGTDRLPYLVDKSPHKQGLLTPGHHIPIFAPDKLLQDQPDVVLVLAWNFAAEVVAQQAEYRRRGGRFLLPIPEAHYWKASAESLVA
jgi:hypothetical protein